LLEGKFEKHKKAFEVQIKKSYEEIVQKKDEDIVKLMKEVKRA
jgi:hypothetical protein